MAIVALPLLIGGLAIVAAARGLLPGIAEPVVRAQAWLATGGAVTMLGIAAIGFGLPIFRA